MLTNDQYPSWLYPVKNGATTIWERLDSYTKENGFGGNNSMNSFNHYSFGAVGAWMFDSSIGIARDENNPGFKHFYLKPMPDFGGNGTYADTGNNLTFARGHYDSVYGRIESSWERMNKGWYRYTFTVPANTTATVILPIIKGCKVLRNGTPIKYDGSLTIGSGSYTFDVIAAAKPAVVQVRETAIDFRSARIDNNIIRNGAGDLMYLIEGKNKAARRNSMRST